MVDVIECARGKLREAVVMEWALDRYGDAKSVSADLARRMEREWFDREVLGHWLHHSDLLVTPRLLRLLPADLFAPVRGEVIENWPGWEQNIRDKALPGLLLNEAAEAATDALVSFLQSIGVPTRIRDLQMPAEDLKAIAEADAAQPSFQEGGRRMTDASELLKFLEEAW